MNYWWQGTYPNAGDTLMSFGKWRKVVVGVKADADWNLVLTCWWRKDEDDMKAAR